MPTIAGSTWSRNCLHYWILGGLFWILWISWAKSRQTKKAPSNSATPKTSGKNIQNVVTMKFLLIRFLKFTSLMKTQWLLLLPVISTILGIFFFTIFFSFLFPVLNSYVCCETPEVVITVPPKSQCRFVCICLVNLKILTWHGVFPPVYLWFLLDCHCHLFPNLPLPDGLISCAEVNVIGKLDVVFALIASGFGFYNKLWKLNNRILEMPQKIIEGS